MKDFSQQPGRPQLAAYYFPNFSPDPRHEAIHGKGWSEWELVKNARPRFPGHDQPKVPLWGFEDESDPAVMAKKINAAADYGVDGFLFDWYWYDGKPFMERALTRGLFGAPNNGRIRYSLMWANHDWNNIHPMNHAHESPLVFKGAISYEEFDRMTDYVIEKHFAHPSYWKINGAPWFMLYEMAGFVEGIGGWDVARKALVRFREKTVQAGFPDLHLTAILWGIHILPGEKTVTSPEEMIRVSGAQSIISYVWQHHIDMKDFPETEYEVPQTVNEVYWEECRNRYAVPYFPNVTMGWDSSPRTRQDEPWLNHGYPFCPVMKTTPEQFRKALEKCAAFIRQAPPEYRIITINAWNEWTEGSYLEPDIRNKFGYLEAIRSVFGPSGR